MLSESQISAYARDGYVVVPNLVEPELIHSFLANENNPHPARAGVEGLKVHRVDPLWSRMARHPSIVGAVKGLIRGEPRIVQTMYLKKPPGAPGIALHQDTHYLPNDPNTLMACWIAFTD